MNGKRQFDSVYDSCYWRYLFPPNYRPGRKAFGRPSIRTREIYRGEPRPSMSSSFQSFTEAALPNSETNRGKHTENTESVEPTQHPWTTMLYRFAFFPNKKKFNAFLTTMNWIQKRKTKNHNGWLHKITVRSFRWSHSYGAGLWFCLRPRIPGKTCGGVLLPSEYWSQRRLPEKGSSSPCKVSRLAITSTPSEAQLSELQRSRVLLIGHLKVHFPNLAVSLVFIGRLASATEIVEYYCAYAVLRQRVVLELWCRSFRTVRTIAPRYRHERKQQASCGSPVTSMMHKFWKPTRSVQIVSAKARFS